MDIHRTAIVHPSVRAGRNVTIGPYAVVDEDVILGDDVRIDAHAMIKPHTRIGKGTRVFSGAVVGEIPQDLKFEGEASETIIGQYVRIREFVTINRGTAASGKTVVGDHSLLMAYVHVAHDCVLGKHCILSNCVNLAGHVVVGDYAVLGGMVAVHQFVHIGRYAFVAGGALVRTNVPPFVRVAREPLRFEAVNRIGLERRNFPGEDIQTIEEIYKHLFVRRSNIGKALTELKERWNGNPLFREILSFIEASRQRGRGLIKGAERRNDSHTPNLS